MEPRANGQPHVPADIPPVSESTLHFEQEADGDDKIIGSGKRNMNVEPSDYVSSLFSYTWR
jgi:hypothetical protein